MDIDILRSFVSYVHAQEDWSLRTFGPGTREKGVIDHISKELKEIENATTPAEKLAEWIDIIILGIDGAWRAIYELEGTRTAAVVTEALAAKQAKNFARVWPDWRTMSEDQAIEHDRSAEKPFLAYKCERCGIRQHAQPNNECLNCGFTLVVNDAEITCHRHSPSCGHFNSEFEL